MIQCIYFRVVARIRFLRSVEMLARRQSNTPLSLSVNRQMRKQRLLIILLPLTLLVSSNRCMAQALSLFTNAAPAHPAISSTGAITVGVKFWSSQPGTISAIKFYRGAASPQGYVANLYSAGGTLLGSATMAQESGPVPGWQQAVFASPISIACKHHLRRSLLCADRRICRHPLRSEPGGVERAADRSGGLGGRWK